MIGDEAECDRAANDNTNRLEDGEACEEESSILREKLERNRRIDRDITANSKANKRGKDEESVVVIGSAETQAEDRSNEACQIKCPATAW